MGRFNSDEAVSEFARLADELIDGGAPVERGMMMGRPILKLGGRMFAALSHDAVGFTLGASTPEHAAALAIEGADLFDPGLSGRAFKDWVAIPLDRSDRWPETAAAAIAHIARR
ncbi:hypothetical protein ACFJGV_07535 [Cnuibacter sp. UC19_7]|uniref:hypothetical protein n=1 Tax=Cnuibacter sp. UC19_7 TaxID=3350166 RepID=UPI0036718B01